MKKAIILTATFLITQVFATRAQDVHFTMFNEAPMLLNPAMTGTFNGNHRIIMNYRNQWKAVGSPFTTYAFSYDCGLMKKKEGSGYLGVGVTAFRDMAGDMNFGTTQANLSVSYHVKLSETNMLTAGLQGGYSARGMEQGNEQWGSQYGSNGFDASIPSNENTAYQNFGYTDYSTGIVWNYFSKEMYSTANNALKIQIGGSFYHANTPKLSFYNGSEEMFSKFTAHAGAWIGLKNTNTSVLPNLLFHKQGPTQQISVGALLRYRLKEESRYTGFVREVAMSLGGFYRVGDAVNPTLQFEIGSLSFGFSYDVNISGLKAATSGRGGLEVFLKFTNPNPFRGGNNQPSFYSPSL